MAPPVAREEAMEVGAFGPEPAGRRGLRLVFSGPPLLKPWQVLVFVLVLAALLKWLDSSAEADDDDNLLILSLWALGLAGLVFLPMWTEVVIDGATRRVHERLGWFRWATAKSSPLSDFDVVAVVRRVKERHEATGAPGTTFSTLRHWRETEYRLELRRPPPLHVLGLPLPPGADKGQVDRLADEVAALGGWPRQRAGGAP
jgi:hypothetical protein